MWKGMLVAPGGAAGATRRKVLSLNGVQHSGAALMEALNVIGARHGIGRVDIVENRLVGVKSHGGEGGCGSGACSRGRGAGRGGRRSCGGWSC